MNAKEFIKKYAYQLEGFLDINQADTSRFHKAYLELSSDDRAFYDHENDRIHLGVTTFPVDEMFEELRHAFGNEVFNNGDIDVIEALYYMANKYLLGHEIQHKRSTRQKDFTAAQDGFIRSLYEEVSRYLKDGYTFRTDKDYDIYPEKLCSKGYLLDENVIRKMAHGIVNAIEDGRIERIRSLKKPGFAKYTSLFRSVIWMCDNSIDSFSEGEPGNKESLIIIINQALSLATSRVYQKGYLSKYGDTKLHRTVKLMVPFIKEGVFSSNSRGIVSPAMNIAKIIAPYFINVASDSNGMSDLSKSMDRMLKYQPGEDEASYNNIGKLEETDDGEGEAPLGISDLGDESDCETDVKAPKERDKSVDTDSSSDSEGGEDPENVVDSSKLDETELKKPSGKDFFSDEDGETVLIKEELSVDSIIHTVLEKMKEAANLMEGDLENVNKTSYNPPENVVSRDIKPFVAKPVEGLENVPFKELFRAYDLTDRLPFALQNRAEHFSKEIDDLFDKEEAPIIRGINAGNLDPKNIYKLALGKIDCFERKDDTNEVDACAYFLLDNSGSMGYGRKSKRSYACMALSVIEAGFSSHMPIKITAFDDDGVVIHEVIKNWDEVLGSSGAINFLNKGRYGSGNMDGYSIRVATEELSLRSESQKMLFILSDGQPAGSHGYGGRAAMADVKKAVEDARALGINVLSIYFSETFSRISSMKEDGDTRNLARYKELALSEIQPFKAMYGDKVVCCAPEEIEEYLVKEMKNFVF